VLLIATLGAIVVLVGCSQLPRTERAGWPDEVRPEVGGLSGVVAIDGHGDLGFRGASMEGSVSFVRATLPDGRVALEHAFEWPRTEAELPLGVYRVSVYTLACVGTCDNLAAENGRHRCDVEVDLAYDDIRWQVNVRHASPSAQMTCDLVRPF
jgi:hypothetical protein